MVCVKHDLYLLSFVFNIVCNFLKYVYHLELSFLVHSV